MEVIEISAPTLDAAKSAAADKLGVPVESLTVSVLEESKGLFGKGTVRIRAEAAGTSEEAAEKPKKGTRSAKVAVSAPEEASEDADAKPARKGRSAKPATEELAAEGEATNGEVAPEVVATEEDAEKVLGLLRGILDAGQLEVTATIAGLNGRYVNVVIDGRDVGHLVGKQGEVLNALQYLLNIIINQQIGNGVRATVDGNDYRRRREDALTKLANTIADQVVQRGEEAVLDALPAFERRIVHKALSENAKVSTYSEGEEPNRRVVIAPAD